MKDECQILEEGQEITIDCLDNQLAKTSIQSPEEEKTNSMGQLPTIGPMSSPAPLASVKKVEKKPTDQNLTAELEELNQLFAELEKMVEEKKTNRTEFDPSLSRKKTNKETDIATRLTSIKSNSLADYSHVKCPFEDEDGFYQELSDFCQSSTRARLVNMLKTCHPPYAQREYTTIKQFGNYYKLKTTMGLNAIIEETGIAHSPLMYIASGLDLELPLLLQSRHIIMVDPCFNNQADIIQVIKKVNQYDNYDPEIKQIASFHYNIRFRFNFGRDLEIVNLDLFGKKYQEYQNFLPLGMIVEYNSSLDHSLAKPDLLTKLMTDGLIINNQASPMREIHLGWLNRLSNTVNPDQIEDQNARHLGLETIRLPNLPFAIYRKQETNPKLINYSESLAEKSVI